MVVLHGDELVPAVAGGDILEGLEFPSGHLRKLATRVCRLGQSEMSRGGGGGTDRAGAYVSDLPALNHIVESLHDFLAGRLSIQTVDLQHIDVRAQPLDGGVDRIEDVLAGESHAVHPLAVVSVARGDRRHVALVAFVGDAKVAFG